MEDTYENVLTLTDEEGNDVDFEVLDVVPMKGVNTPCCCRWTMIPIPRKR